jgi:hypothetical protein
MIDVRSLADLLDKINTLLALFFAILVVPLCFVYFSFMPLIYYVLVMLFIFFTVKWIKWKQE